MRAMFFRSRSQPLPHEACAFHTPMSDVQRCEGRDWRCAMYYLGLREGVLGNGGPVSFASLVTIVPAGAFAYTSKSCLDRMSSRNTRALARSGKVENVCMSQTQAYCKYRCCSFIKISTILLHNNAFKSQQHFHPRNLPALPPSSRSSKWILLSRGQTQRSPCRCYPLGHR
jgi:hypothetical protein